MLVQVMSDYQTSRTIPNVGTLKVIRVGAYLDADLMNKAEAIDWGTLMRGTKKDVVVYIYNKGNSPMTLSLSVSNWDPLTTSDYITLTWDYNGQKLNAGETLQVTLTLAINANIVGIDNFSFDTSIIGEG